MTGLFLEMESLLLGVELEQQVGTFLLRLLFYNIIFIFVESLAPKSSLFF